MQRQPQFCLRFTSTGCLTISVSSNQDRDKRISSHDAVATNTVTSQVWNQAVRLGEETTMKNKVKDFLESLDSFIQHSERIKHAVRAPCHSEGHTN